VIGGPVKVVVADDHPFIILGILKAIKGAEIDVVGTANSPAELFKLLEHCPCHVILTDYSMPNGKSVTGWEFLATLSSAYPSIPTIVYTEFYDPFLVGSLRLKGIRGLVSKRDEVDELKDAILQVANGQPYLSPLVHDAAEIFLVMPEFRPFLGLTRRQMEVVGLMLCGCSVSETAKLLRRSVNTVSAQRSEACRRLGFASESEVYRFAVTHRLRLDHTLPGIEGGCRQPAPFARFHRPETRHQF